MYYETGQVWIKQLADLAGDDVWRRLSEPEQLRRANLRAEWLDVPKTDDKLEPFGLFTDQTGFAAPRLLSC